MLASETKSTRGILSRAFPTPRSLTPLSAGIDISDASIKWLALEATSSGVRIKTYGDVPLAAGAVVNGVVKDVAALAAALREVKKKLGGITLAHAALPEEAAYVFSMHVPEGSSHEQALRMIEFEFEGRVPIKPSAAVYDFDVITERDGTEGREIGVAVFPRELAESYVSAFHAAGILLLSLEIEARSIARAVAGNSLDEPITLLVDFGRARTGFAVLKCGIPIFTSTVEVGGDAMTQSLIQKLSMTPQEAEMFKNDQGLTVDPTKNAQGAEMLIGIASALGDEVARHYHYWDTRRNERGDRMTPVGRVLLVGGSSNLKGLTDYIASRVQAPTELGTIWQRSMNFNEYIPPIDARTSLQFATATGLALRGITL